MNPGTLAVKTQDKAVPGLPLCKITMRSRIIIIASLLLTCARPDHEYGELVLIVETLLILKVKLCKYKR